MKNAENAIDFNEGFDFQIKNNNIYEAYEYFLYFNLTPLDIAQELLDFPDIINDPFDRDEYEQALDQGLITKQNNDDFDLISTLNKYYCEFSESRKLFETENYRQALDYYLAESNISDYVPSSFKKKMREFRKPEILSSLCTYLQLSNLSRQAYSDKNYVASNMMYHMALEYLIDINLTLDKNVILSSNRIIKSVWSENGKKGALSKAKNYEKAKAHALQLHDEKYNKTNKAGKFVYSASKAAELIKTELISQGKRDLQQYGINSLANVIRKHRKIK